MRNKSLKLPGLIIIFSCFISFSPLVSGDENDCNFRQVTKRIYVIIGSDHSTCSVKEIEHPLTNPSAIIGDNGVIIVDPGSSLQVGRLLLDRLNSLTKKPVVAIFNTHIHGLYWLGNQAIKKRYPNAKIFAHKNMVMRIKSGEGEFWVRAITGKYKGEKTKYILPNISLNGGETRKIAGLNVKIHHVGHAHTDHDILIEFPDEKAVFLGGLVVEPEVPSQGVPRDANFHGQIAATEYAIEIGAETYVPGRGNPGNVELPKRAVKFLKSLYSGVRQYYQDGLTDYEITKRLKSELSEFEKWYDFTQLGGVVSQMYLQIEKDDF